LVQDKRPEEILPGLYKLKIPVPIKSLGSVFAYFVFDGQENLLIDAGWSDYESLHALRDSLSSIGFEPSKINSVIVSHLHPDHFGLIESIMKESKSCKVLMHIEDAKMIKQDQKDYVQFLESLDSWIKHHGTPSEEAKAMLESSFDLAKSFRPVMPDVQLRGGERIRVGSKWEFEVIWTPGHTKGTICLYERNGSDLLFSGDHVLPTITPNVSLTPNYRGDPLGDYLNSLDKVEHYKVSRVLPSHEYVFSKLEQRINEIRAHHEKRAEEALSAVGNSPGIAAYEVATKLFWYTGSWEKLSAWERRAALLETLAHLEYLKRKGKIRETDLSAEDGFALFSSEKSRTLG
jgi:glyoxylase-like metal-dependent hydrolase (beta-lactamase superfamily II)